MSQRRARECDMYCESAKRTVGILWIERNVLDENPDYQRESGVWSTEKKQLFLDSLLNGYDIPKIYLHDLREDRSNRQYAIVDGKQRLAAIWDFLSDQIALAPDFELTTTVSTSHIPPGSVFSGLSSDWKERFKSIALDVVLIKQATEDDIEELFSRLNNGEPLNAAENRNARGGRMTDLIRDTAKHPFFAGNVRFSDRRYQYRDVATKLLAIEQSALAGSDMFRDLTKRHLDDLVDNNRDLATSAANKLQNAVTAGLADMRRVFQAKDPLLARQTYAPLYYLFVRTIARDYAHKELFTKIHAFLENFTALRAANLAGPEDQRDPTLDDFGLLMQQGTMKGSSLRQRVAILTRYFLSENSDVTLRDQKRSYTTEERLVIWLLGAQVCAECKRHLADISEMEADHELQWAFGGATTIGNARCLCTDCNLKLARKTK